MQDIIQVLIEHLDGVSVAGMEGQSDHGTDLSQIDLQHPVIICKRRGIQLFEGIAAAVQGQPIPHLLVRLPDGEHGRGFRGHHINAVAEIHAQIADARAHKFKHPVLHKAVLKHLANEGQRHILRADARHGAAGQVHQDHLRIGDVIGAAQQLLGKLSAALAGGQRSQRAVACVAVRAQDHLAAARVHFAHELMHHSLMRGQEHSAVFFRRPHGIQVIVLVAGAVVIAQGIMAAGKHKGNGKGLHAAGDGRFQHAHVGHILAYQRIKLDLQVLHAA